MPITLRNMKGVPTASQALVFRDVSYRGLLFAGAFFGFIALYAVLPKGGNYNWAAAFIPGILALLLTGWGIARSLQSVGSRWLMIADTEGLHINMGYAEGYSVKQAEPPVLFLPREEINAIWRTREVLRVAHRFGATRHHLGYLDIALCHPAPEAIQREMSRLNERYAAAGKAGPFPIRFITPVLMRLCWSAIHPGETAVMRHLAPSCDTGSIRTAAYPEWDSLNREQRDIFLDELWRMGMRAEALFLARMHLGVSLKDAAALMRARAENP